MSPIVPLTAIQQKALALISAGSTIAAAASETGVHRNTVGNWLRSSNFRQSLELACLDQAIFWRDQAHQMAGDALAAIRAILTDPKAPAAVRLRAALAVLEKASAPLPQLPAGLREWAASPAPENAPPMHNSAQRVPEINHMQAPEPAPMHNHAQPQPPKSVLSTRSRSNERGRPAGVFVGRTPRSAADAHVRPTDPRPSGTGPLAEFCLQSAPFLVTCQV